MSEELEVVNGNGANGATNSNVSPAKTIDGAPDQSQVLLNIQKQLEQTRSELRGLQGRQDKETNDVQRAMGELKKRLDSGMSFDEAQKSIAADNEVAAEKALIRKIAEKVGVLDESPSTPAGNGQPMANDKASTLQQYGLDANDADVAEAIRGKSDPLEIKLAALEVAYKRATKPSPDASASTAVQGRPAPKSDTGAMIARLQELQKFPTQNKQEIATLKKQLDERNWE